MVHQALAWKAPQPDEEVSPEVQVLIREHELFSMRRALAINDYVNQETQEILAQDEHSLVVQALAYNQQLATSAMMLIASSKHSEARMVLASRPGIPAEVQHALANDPDVMVVCALAKISTTLPEVQEILVQQHGAVRYHLAGNPGLLPHLQDVLSDETDMGILHALAGNRFLRPDLQIKLAKTRDRSVLLALATTHDLTPELGGLLTFSDDHRVWSKLMQNEAFVVSSEMGARFVRYADTALYYQTLKDTDPEVLKGLESNWEGSLAGLVEAASLVLR